MFLPPGSHLSALQRDPVWTKRQVAGFLSKRPSNRS